MRQGEESLHECLTKEGKPEVQLKDLETSSPSQPSPQSDLVWNWVRATGKG